MVERALDRDRPVARNADHEAELELDVERPRRPEVARPALAGRAAHRRAARHHRARAAVVADRQLEPVRQQRLVVGPEHQPDVARVVDRRVEVDVVGHRERQGQLRGVELGAVELRRPAGRPARHQLVERARPRR